MSLRNPIASKQNRDVTILGIGNSLMGDDGVGIRVVEILASQQLPPYVTVLEAGLPGWGLPSWFEGKTDVILVDAMRMGQAPGTWKRFLPHEIQVELESNTLSLHQPDLACGLALSQELNIWPDNMLLYGIEPEDLSPGASLSPAVTACLPDVIASIMLDVEKINQWTREEFSL